MVSIEATAGEKNTTENDMTDYQCGMVEISALMRLKEEIMMINLTGKIVFIKTQEDARKHR